MSFLQSREVPCQFCQFPNEVEIWSVINTKEDPELKDLLLGGELNLAECTECKKIFYAEGFLLYHDPESELMAFVYPLSTLADKAACELKTKVDFARSQADASPEHKISYEPLTLFGLDELVRLVEWDEESKIQSEIVTVLSQQENFEVKKLKPSFARENKLPRVLPFQSDSQGSFRDSSLLALERLEKINDRLDIYTEAKKILAQTPALEVQFV